MGNTIIPNLSVDHVIEEGTYAPPTGGITWTYRKWASGVAECWGHWDGTESLSSASSPFVTQWVKQIAYPPNLFIGYPCVSSSASIGTGYAILAKNYPHKDQVHVLYYASATGTASITAWFYVVGNWKYLGGD